MHIMIIESNAKTAKWLCCDGTELTASEMSDQHLANVLAMLNRFDGFGEYCNHNISDWKLYFEFERNRRKERKVSLEAKLLASKARLKDRQKLLAYLKDQVEEAQGLVYGELENIEYLETELAKIS